MRGEKVGVELRPEVLGAEIAAAFGGDEVGNDSTSTHFNFFLFFA